MSILGLELNDTGILAWGGDPPGFLELDGQARQSPGFALPVKKGLLVGKAAESKARLFPRRILSHSWDQPGVEPIKSPGRGVPKNHAEIIYSHLDSIWAHTKGSCAEVVMLVPGFYNLEQLGLILDIANKISMPVKGFVPLALASSSIPHTGKTLLYLDIYLHRMEVSYLEQGDKLIFKDCVTTTEKGFTHLVRGLVDTIAHEFVRATRFDPLHQAASEQELYDRLPGILSHISAIPSMLFEMAGGTTHYQLTLGRDLLVSKAEPFFGEIRNLISGLLKKHGTEEQPVVLQCSHRLMRLPGLKETLGAINNAQPVELDQGVAASSLPELWRQLRSQGQAQGVLLHTSRPWGQSPRAIAPE